MRLLDPNDVTDPLMGLVSGVRSGDATAIDEFVRATAPLLLRVVRQILGVYHPEVPDVVQEASFAAIDSLQRFRGEAKVSHFVWRVAALTAMNARRRYQLRERYAAPLPDYDLLGSSEPCPYGLLVSAKRREAFRRLIDELPATQAEALTMYGILGFTVEEAAAVAGVPPNTLRSRLISAKSALRQKIAGDSELAELIQGVS